MRNACSYEGILSAVGRVLDEAGVKRIAIEDTGDGLTVEGFDASGGQISLRYDVPALFDLVRDQLDSAMSASSRTARDEGTLHQFLEHRELVGAR